MSNFTSLFALYTISGVFWCIFWLLFIMLLFLLWFIFLGRKLTQSLLIWSAQRRHVNLRMWMTTVVTAFLCPTLRSTTTTSMTSSKMLRLTQSDQSKRQDSKSVCAFWSTMSCWRLVCTNLVWIQVISGAIHCMRWLSPHIWVMQLPNCTHAGTPN